MVLSDNIYAGPNSQDLSSIVHKTLIKSVFLVRVNTKAVEP